MQCDILHHIKLVSYGFVLYYYQLTFDLLKGDDNNEVTQVYKLETTFANLWNEVTFYDESMVGKPEMRK